VPFQPSGFFVLRAPLLPFSEFCGWAEGSPDRRLLRDRLLEKLSRPEIREALFIASPDLDRSLQVRDPDPDGKRGLRLEQAAVRYFARMSGRPTPFGLFAGCCVGRLGRDTRLLLEGRARARRHTRLDMHYLDMLSLTLARRPSLREALTYSPNSSLYRAGGRLRYAQWEPHPVHRAYNLVTLAADGSLDLALAMAREGIRPGDLAAALAARLPAVTAEEASAYVDDLIANQILLPELAPRVTGAVEPLPGLARELRAAPQGAAVADVLEEVGRKLGSLDAAGVGAPVEVYRAIGDQLAALGAPVDFSKLFQVDLIHDAPQASLGPAVLEEIERGAAVLQRIGGGSEPDPMAAFRARFEERFAGAEVPLLEALDDEVGIGFRLPGDPQGEVPPLVAGLQFPAVEAPARRWEARHDWMLGRIEETACSGGMELQLEPRDVERLERPDAPPLPDAFSVFASVAAASEEAVSRGEFRVFLGALSGPSGARYFGRFCHADPELKRRVEEHLRAEEALDADAVYAEIVHLPEGRLGNLIVRPLLRDYEIPYLGRSGAPAERQIHLSDLLVSVDRDRVVLRSRRLGRRIVPRLTNAHHYSRLSLWIYAFLCSLEKQGVAGTLGWDWGPLESAAFLPRVTCGRLVLSRARWRLRGEEAAGPAAPGPSGLLQRLQSRRAEGRLPRFVALKQNDHLLPVDLDNVLSLEAMAAVIDAEEDAVLEEIYPPPELLLARGPDGPYAHEIIVPFVRARPASAAPAASHDGDRRARTDIAAGAPLEAPAAPLERRAAPGSEWLYVKLYCGPLGADQILREIVGPLVREARRGGALRGWFFIRFADPHPHLRLRLQGQPARLLGETLPALHAALAPLRERGTLWKLQLDTYEREVERYGGEAGVLLAERIFEADSEAALEVLETLGEEEPPDARWQVVLCSVDRLLADFDADLARRLEQARRLRDAYAREFRADKGLRVQIGERFRRQRAALEALLEPDSGHPLPAALAPLERRSVRLRPLVAELEAREREGALGRPLREAAAAFAHMAALRLLRSAPRPQELVIYDFLCRLYESRQARTRGRGPEAGRR